MFATNGMLAVGVMAGLAVMGPNFLADHDHDKGDHKEKKNQDHSKSCEATGGDATANPIRSMLEGGGAGEAMGGSPFQSVFLCNNNLFYVD